MIKNLLVALVLITIILISSSVFVHISLDLMRQEVVHRVNAFPDENKKDLKEDYKLNKEESSVPMTPENTNSIPESGREYSYIYPIHNNRAYITVK